MSTYKRRPESDTWHFNKKCSNYPTKQDAISRSKKPASGEKCNECMAKSKKH